MRSLEWYWNIIAYCAYQGFKKLSNVINYVNPSIYILKIPAVKRFYVKLGINDIEKQIQISVDNPQSGINFIQTGILMGSITVLFTYAIFNCIQYSTSISIDNWAFENDKNGLIFIIIILLPSFLFNYFTLFKEDKYLKYFKKFDEMHSGQKVRYYWISVMLIVFIVMFFFKSLKFTK